MLYQLVLETPDGEFEIATGTHRAMWEMLRKQQDPTSYFVCLKTMPVLGGSQETPKGLRSAGLFPGVRKCVRKQYNRTTRQRVRLELHMIQKAGCQCAIC